MRDFRKLTVWHKGHQTVLVIYRATQYFPEDERYSLTSQIRRAAVSLPANIAEGCDKHTDAECAQHMQISMEAASELEHHLLLAYDLNYIDMEAYSLINERVIEFKHTLVSFITTLHEKD